MIKNILITHGYSDSNKGDLAITYATYTFLKKKYSSAKIIIHSTFRDTDKKLFSHHNRFMQQHDVTIRTGILPSPYLSENKSLILDIIAAFRFIKEIAQLKISLFHHYLGKIFGGQQFRALLDYKKSDMIIFKGGQYIYNDHESVRGYLFLWRTLQPLNIAHKLKKKSFILGQSFGGFKSKRSELIATQYLSLCNKIFARESQSLEFLKCHNLESKSSIIPDLAFYLKSDGQFKSQNLPKIMHNGNHFAITLVNWSFPESDKKETAKKLYETSITDACIYMQYKYSLTPIFMPQVTLRHHNKSDADTIDIITNRLSQNRNNYINFEDDFSLDELMQIYKECKFIIGTRLHSCILAAIVGTPILPIRYQGYKTQGIASALGQQKLMLDIHEMSTNRIVCNMEHILRHRNQIQQELHKRTSIFQQEINKINLY